MTINDKSCRHTHFGYDVIDHDGISHPSGVQHCLDCGLTIDQIIANTRKQCEKERWEMPCRGCGHHDSMWKTLIQSDEWQAWYKYQSGDSQEYDVDEAQELGCMSKEHWNDFIRFVSGGK